MGGPHDTEHPGPGRPPPGDAACFAFLADVMGWLGERKLTIEEAEQSIARACAMPPGGARPEAIVEHFMTRHDVPAEDAWRVSEIAAFCHYRGVIKRTRGGRYRPARSRDQDPCVVAVLEVPLTEWPDLEKYVASGRLAWVAGEEDRA